ncbi:unnamed protein product, partial [marine sediment metagenome]
MNGIYLYLLLQEIRDKLLGLYINEIRSMHRMVQIICGDKALFVSLYPEAPAIFFSERIKKNFEKLKSFSDNVCSSRIKNVEQPNFMPVMKLELERLDIAGKSEVEIIISLYRAAPNFSIKTARSQKNLFPRYLEKCPKKSIIELTEKYLQSNYTQKGIDFKERLVKEIEGVDKKGNAMTLVLLSLFCILPNKYEIVFNNRNILIESERIEFQDYVSLKPVAELLNLSYVLDNTTQRLYLSA